MKINIRGKLTIVILLIGVSIILFTGLFGYSVGKNIIKKGVFSHLTSVKASKAYQIEKYFSTIEMQISSLSEDHMIVEAMQEFKDAFSEIANKSEQNIDIQMSSKLKDYYETGFLRKLNSQNVENVKSGLIWALGQIDTTFDIL